VIKVEVPRHGSSFLFDGLKDSKSWAFIVRITVGSNFMIQVVDGSADTSYAPSLQYYCGEERKLEDGL
jgi:hypothetical protein